MRTEISLDHGGLRCRWVSSFRLVAGVDSKDDKSTAKKDPGDQKSIPIIRPAEPSRYFAVRYMNRKVLCASAKTSERSSVIGSENSSERAGYYAKDAKIQIRVQIEGFTTWDRVAQVVFERSHLTTVASGDSL